MSNCNENKLDKGKKGKDLTIYIVHPDHFFLLNWKILIKQILQQEKCNSVAILFLYIIKPINNIKYKISEKFFRLRQEWFQYFFKK